MPENATTLDLRAEAHALVDSLPPNSTWEDLMYRIYVRQAVEQGLKEVEEGRGLEVDEVRRRFGLSV